MSETDVEKLAERLVARYGSEAVTVATRQADAYFKQGDVLNYADWCLVIGEVEQLVASA